VGGHHRQAGFTSQPQRGLYHAFHLGIVHALDFQIKAAGKQAFPVLRPAHGFFALTHGQCHPDIAQMRTGQAQQIAVVALFQPGALDFGTATVLVVGEGLGQQFA
jgi:hypothetical protein